jgi:hypothetical protein
MKCCIIGCRRVATRVSLANRDTPGSVLCSDHYGQVSKMIHFHRKNGWLDNDVKTSINVYKKKQGGRLIAFQFEDDVLCLDII